MKPLLRFAILACALPAMLLSGCRHHSSAAYAPPPPPLAPSHPAARAAVVPTPADTSADLRWVETHRPIWTETGVASWYGPPYDRRRGANGQIYDQNAMTAAHRTLPMNSLIRVTNLKNGRQAIVRITDRGPFVPGRVLDLSLASAKEIGSYLPGTAPVRIDVYATPAPIETGGRWCVQIGAFQHSRAAEKLRDRLERQYSQARVIEFAGPTGHWVRIRPAGDDKRQAVQIARSLKPSEGEAYLVRLD